MPLKEQIWDYSKTAFKKIKNECADGYLPNKDTLTNYMVSVEGRIRVVAFTTGSTTEDISLPQQMNTNGADGMGRFKTSGLCLCLV
jgi:hypothetical protein